MHEGIGLFELLMGCGSIATAGVAQWVHMKVTVGKMQSQIEFLEKRVDKEEEDNKERQTRIYSKIENIFQALEEIKIAMAKKK